MQMSPNTPACLRVADYRFINGGGMSRVGFGNRIVGEIRPNRSRIWLLNLTGWVLMIYEVMQPCGWRFLLTSGGN